MLRRNECRLNFKNRPVRTGDLKGGGPKQPPPLPLIGVARSLPLIGLNNIYLCRHPIICISFRVETRHADNLFISINTVSAPCRLRRSAVRAVRGGRARLQLTSLQDVRPAEEGGRDRGRSRGRSRSAGETGSWHPGPREGGGGPGLSPCVFSALPDPIQARSSRNPSALFRPCLRPFECVPTRSVP